VFDIFILVGGILDFFVILKIEIRVLTVGKPSNNYVHLYL
jgi:hypothetical protein